MSDKKNYYCKTTIVLPKGMETRFPPLSMKSNVKFLQFMEKVLEEQPDLLIKKPSLTDRVNFRIPVESKQLFEGIKQKLKESSISFSSLYRLLYDKFVKEALDGTE